MAQKNRSNHSLSFQLFLLRRKRGLSQWQAGKRADIPSYRISAFERGRVTLTPEEIDRLRAVFSPNPGEAAQER